jgi:3-hydroxyisobutyrate dehydrogenase
MPTSTPPGTVGLVGVGRMGLAICQRLLTRGYSVTVFDICADRAAAARAAGADVACSLEAATRVVDVLITVLPGSPELRDVVAPVIAATPCAPNWSWIDMTTASPTVGRELQEAALAKAIACVEAPMGGGPVAAAEGELQLFVGGPAETVDRHRELLGSLGRVIHLGGLGSGYTTKLLVNLLWFGHAVGTGEALILARRTGLDLDVVREALGASAAASEFIRDDLDALLDGDYLSSFGLDRCVEELDAIADEAAELGVPFALSTTVRDLYARALDRYGPVNGELLAVALLEEQAGIRLRRGSQ